MKYRESEYVVTPHGNSYVWRYMNHCKFLKLLSDSSLFFPNATKLSDQYEITIPDNVLQSKREELEKSGLNGRNLDEKLAAFNWEKNPMKDLVLINCWSMNPHESYALWKIYLSEEKNGVAIRSTISSLKRAIQTGGDLYPEDFFIGKIKYRSRLKQNELERLFLITTKKPFYDFEKEVRVFIINEPESEDSTVLPYKINEGRSVKIDLLALVHDVYVSPFADPNYSNEIESLLKDNGLKVGVLKQSKIRDK